MSRRGLLALTVVGAGLLVIARLGAPQAPPLYDGITIAPDPFRYCSPPPDLASSNKVPASGQMDLQLDNGSSKLATVQTDDKQVLAFFPAETLTTSSPKITVKISPECAAPPPPPTGNTLVGNVYRIEVAGVTPPPALAKPAQVLLRIPPAKLSSVQAYYDGAWHDTQWSVQTDYINLSMDHLGLIAALDDGKHSQPPPAPPPGKFNLIGTIEAGLVVVAIVIVVAGVIVQRRRTRAEAAAAPPKDDVKAGKADDPEWGPKKRE